MTQSQIEYAPINSRVAEVMQKDIDLLTIKARADAKLYLAHPEWHAEDGSFLPQTKVRGGIDHLIPAAHETLIPGAVQEIDKTGEEGADERNAPDKKIIIGHIRKATKHIQEIMRARLEPDDKTKAAVASHIADYEIEMRELKKFKLPESCFDCLELAFHISIAKEHEQRKWHTIAQKRHYVEINGPSGGGVGIG